MVVIRLNDASEITIKENGVQTAVVKSNEILTNAVSFTPVDMTLDDIQRTFVDDAKTATMHVIDKDTEIEMTTLTGYSKMNSINVVMESEKVFYTVQMIQPTDIVSLRNSIVEALDGISASNNEAANKITSFNSDMQTIQNDVMSMKSDLSSVHSQMFPDVSAMDLEHLKEYRIGESKLNLAAWLADHPLESTAHKGTSGLYSVTAEKQSLLQAAIMVAQLHQTSGDDEYQISWNETGKECTYDWTLEELTTLALEISNYVRPYVSAQQSKETEIVNAVSIEDVNAVVLTYDDVVVE